MNAAELGALIISAAAIYLSLLGLHWAREAERLNRENKRLAEELARERR